jgi:hypothetical protein
MDALAKHIRKRLKSKKSCVVTERDLDPVWPRGPLSPESRKRRFKILEFARANNWEATIYEPGLRVSFRKLGPKPKRAMRIHDHPAIAAEVDKIRAEIEKHGESRVGKDELFLLRSSEVSDAQGLIGISEIAEWERWTFEYLKDGSVRFTSL